MAVSALEQVRDPRLPPGMRTSLGGPRGRRARPRGGGPLAALAPAVLLLGIPLTVAALRQAGCTEPGWEGRTPVWRQCASPLVASVPADDLGRGLLAYLAGVVHLDLPPVAGSVVTLLAGLAPGAGAPEQRWFLLGWTALAAVILSGLVVAVGTVRHHPLADPVALALSPVVALTVLLSADLVPVALAVVAVWAWSRERARLAGVLAGLALLGGAASAAVLLAMLLVPGRGGRRAVGRLLLAAAVTLLFVTAPLVALDAGTVLRPVLAWWNDGAGPGSAWFIPELARHPIGPGHVAVISVLGVGVAVGLGVILARQRPRPPVADVALLVLAVAMVTATALPVQAGLWLVPFVALAGIPWRDHLLWAGAEAVHLVAYYTWVDGLTDPAKGLPAGWYACALALRLLAVGRLGWVVWARALWGTTAPRTEPPTEPPTAPPTPAGPPRLTPGFPRAQGHPADSGRHPALTAQDAPEPAGSS